MKISKSQDFNIVIRDLNAKVGKGRHDDTVGTYGSGKKNERGKTLVKWAKINNMIVGNTWFSQHPRRLWTSQGPEDRTRTKLTTS